MKPHEVYPLPGNTPEGVDLPRHLPQKELELGLLMLGIYIYTVYDIYILYYMYLLYSIVFYYFMFIV